MVDRVKSTRVCFYIENDTEDDIQETLANLQSSAKPTQPTPDTQTSEQKPGEPYAASSPTESECWDKLISAINAFNAKNINAGKIKCQ